MSMPSFSPPFYSSEGPSCARTHTYIYKYAHTRKYPSLRLFFNLHRRVSGIRTTVGSGWMTIPLGVAVIQRGRSSLLLLRRLFLTATTAAAGDAAAICLLT